MYKWAVYHQRRPVASVETGSSVHRSPTSIGIQHLSSSGHVSRYEFAQAIIRIMKELSGTPDGWASVKPITSDQYPLPARRPRHPVMSKDKVKRIFGIEIPHWEDQLRAFLETRST